MSRIGTLTINGQEYVVIPKAKYLEMTGIPEGSVDATEFARAAIANSLMKARKTAGLTQNELAKKLKVSQSMVANAEAGRTLTGRRRSATRRPWGRGRRES